MSSKKFLLVILILFANYVKTKDELEYDAVITWVNGSDPIWRYKYVNYTNTTLSEERFRDNNELK